MEKKALIEVVRHAFPLVDKPSDGALTVHGRGCPECGWVLKHLSSCAGKEIPVEMVRRLFDEFSTLTPKAMLWVMPSYLMAAINSNDRYDQVVQFFIYSLAPAEEYLEDARERLSLMNDSQRSCLIDLLGYWANHEIWKDWCEEEITKAISFVESLAS